jgi:flagellar assembly protein FliH
MTRTPKFLAEVLNAKAVERVTFKRLNGDAGPSTDVAHRNGAKVEAASPASEKELEVASPVELPMAVSAPAPAAITTDVPPNIDRIAGALENFRLHAEHLAEQARSDALEIGFQVARRILEIELSTSPEPLFALIRSAVQRVGESRKVSVRLCPSDLSRVDAGGGKAAMGLSIVQLEMISDSALSPGDCIVDGDFGAVDGRINTRLQELRRTVTNAVEGEAA